MADFKHILVDEPLPGVSRITLNRPDSRNALNNTLRSEIYGTLEANDNDPDVKVTILRGAGKAFCAGYDLKGNNSKNQPFHTSPGDGNWARHVVDGFFRVWDLAKPVIAQVHGYCLAGGTELATSCDLVYVANDAQIGYPVVRSMSPPDNQFFPHLMGLRPAMEMMLTGDAISGDEAVTYGFANRAFPVDALETEVLKVAERIARVPTDLQQMNKRAVHRQMELTGVRAAIRSGTEIQALAFHTESTRAHFKELAAGLTDALSKRDGKFGDYRTTDNQTKNGDST
ncbi:enoyl-CoA hydratase-related protein [Pseudomonadales bacterium]|nr:enoyl-CoA hydratase-related protein [Pseudomonadales bacterium]MDC0997038.1 enoyl-CoA hydratase-related protein [Pseudomonadales bacterium]MDG1000927.1 enoyl-CoA hydratase-related protein [Pseudomonadales bacterium]MDG1304620.1 enoyl-CoA hydratase-related protein [Pseudomonadales bacterium]MDG1907658.1 enoyl-CoA hydratase-related protein [Pseudomonadales bacterium]|tara:strand:- start:392 stop:1246 length:855 start_codon:yes stop_codon:yes gene_type:complete